MRSSPAGALERARFGPLRTLNVRSAMLTGNESAARVERWLRSKQVELTGEVLVITGRGAGSIGAIPVVKEATKRVLNRLRRIGVIESFGEDTPGSFVVRLAPLRALLEAPARRKTPTSPPRPSSRIEGLKSETRDRLKNLAESALDSLGVRSPSKQQIDAEMQRQFSAIVRTAPTVAGAERWLDHAINRALREYEDADR